MRLITSEGPIGPTAREPPRGGSERDPALQAGLAEHRAGGPQDAQSRHGGVLQFRPNDPIAHFRRALARGACRASANYNLGLALQEAGHSEEAAACYERAVALAPDLAPAHNNLGVLRFEAGRHAEAAACFARAIEGDPYSAEAHSNSGAALKVLGRPVEAIHHHQVAIRIDPDDPEYRAAFMECLSDLPLTKANDHLLKDLIETLAFGQIGHQELAFPLASLICGSPAFQRLASCVGDRRHAVPVSELWGAGLAELCADALFLQALNGTILRDPLIERVLTQVRRALLQGEYLEMPAGGFPLDPFVFALARQCFENEYVFAVSDEEIGQLQSLRERRLPRPAATGNGAARSLGILACYMPLSRFVEEDGTPASLLGGKPGEGSATLLTQQIVEPREERRLRRGIETVGSFDDRTSRDVRAQYEDNPYPRWLGASTQKGEPLRRLMKRLFQHIRPEQIPDQRRVDILVAGCGTGKQAIDRAVGIRASQVLGIDLSLASLAFAKRKAVELAIGNVEFKHADLLNLHLLNRSFDMIECIGVLHHMQDPVRGWALLVEHLRPGGVMRIGLYSETARRSIVAAQAFVAARGYGSSADGIRACRQDILATGSPEVGSASRIVDFYTTSECRDLLFHVSEKRFTLPAIGAILEELGLRFVGFEFGDPLQTQRYVERFPDDPTAISLENWHRYEKEHPDTFIGLYLFWVQKPASGA